MKRDIDFLTVVLLGLAAVAATLFLLVMTPQAKAWSTKLPVENRPAVTQPVVVETTPGTTYTAAWPDKNWTASLERSLDEYGKNMLLMSQPKDASKWCPQFETFKYEQRKQVFITLISSMAKRESNWKPNTKYTESFTDSKGKKVISRGLLQISQESANQSAYKCGITDAEYLHDAGVNLRCGVKILNYWIPKDGYIGTNKLGGGRYWSVMRDGSSKDFILSQVKSKCLELSKVD